jgi:hypothetical protein
MTIKALYPTVRPSLNLDFAKTKVLDPRITFTRASTATFVGANGLTQTAASDVPRFDHNPTTGESLGLLVEEARTNLLLNSATLSTQSVTVAAAANTLSFYGTGTVTLTGVGTAGPLVGTGVNNRVSLTFTPTVGVLVLTVSGSVTNAQLEAGSFPTSYIPTTSATVTRAADVASMTGANFSSWYNQSQGTWFVDFANDAAKHSSGFDGVLSLDTNTPRIIGSSIVGFGGESAISPVSARQKVGLAYGATEGRSSNGSISSGSGGTVSSRTQVRIGTGAVTASDYELSTTISRLAFYPVRLPDAQLQALTAT